MILNMQFDRLGQSYLIHFAISLACTFGIVLLLNPRIQSVSLHQLSPALCATMAVKLSDCLPKKRHKLGVLSPYFGIYSPSRAILYLIVTIFFCSKREANTLVLGEASDIFKSSACTEA